MWHSRSPRDPPPLHGKNHLKFPFWLLEPLPWVISGHIRSSSSSSSSSSSMLSPSVTGSAPSRGAGPGAVTSSLNLGLVTREQQVLFTFLNIFYKLISVQKVREYFCPNFWCLLFHTFQGQLVSCSASNSPLSPPLITSTSLNLRREM